MVEPRKKRKKPYAKPVAKKQEKMVFTTRIVESFGSVVCRQCSSCHGCR